MFSAAGFAKTWEYIDLFKQGLVCIFYKIIMKDLFCVSPQTFGIF